MMIEKSRERDKHKIIFNKVKIEEKSTQRERAGERIKKQTNNRVNVLNRLI